MTTALTYLDQSHFIHGFYSLIFRSLCDAQEHLREWTREEIGKEVMLESMELLTQATWSTPNFEADRLREKKSRRASHFKTTRSTGSTRRSLRKENPFHPDKKR